MVYHVKSIKSFYFSPLRYPGGKSSLYPLIFELIEQSNDRNITYVEPYAGGSGVALSLLMLEKVSDIVINDYDYAIYCFWKSILENTDKFIRKIENVDVSIKEWEKQKRIYQNTDSELSLGFSTFFLNRTNYSGVINARPIGGIEQKGKWRITARFNKKALIDRIRRISYYKNRITIKNEDGINLINKYSRYKDIFIYLDPPYYVNGTSLYLNSYDHDDHLALSKSLKKKNSLRWLLTYDNVSEIKSMYDNYEIVPFQINYSANQICRGNEVMIFSKPLKVPQYLNS